MVDQSEFILEERCNMADALAMVPSNELIWHDKYWEKMKEFDDVMASCERKRRKIER